MIPLIAICGALVADAAEDADGGKKRYFNNCSILINMTDPVSHRAFVFSFWRVLEGFWRVFWRVFA